MRYRTPGFWYNGFICPLDISPLAPGRHDECGIHALRFLPARRTKCLCKRAQREIQPKSDHQQNPRSFQPISRPQNLATSQRVTSSKSIPLPVISHLTTLEDFACGFVSWNQYTLLAAPRHLLNPRFNLTTPLVSGLFYIAPGLGFILGAVVGGKLSDMTVIKYIKIRGGVRLPQDRLNSGLSSFFFLAPVSSLIYGWGLQYEVGGLALPIVTAFFSAVGINMAFASLNTYCAEVLPKQRTEVVASKYVIQYSLSSIGCGVIINMIDAIGVGPAQTLGKFHRLPSKIRC